MKINKKKVINDPIYGFITIPGDLIFDIIEHPYFQRLRRIRQLGLADYTYPGALHTRFHHALGAMHLMGLALSNLKSKGHEISAAETEAAQIAVLLHDIGHGPFSHSLEQTLLKDTDHEQLSLYVIECLNDDFNHALNPALEMFKNTYKRKFFHQLISSQLDIDRLDYLQRDSFFTGVSEGTIGADRIIKMLEIKNDELVVEEKGIYSIENFLNARRLMYWQVYLHKIVVSAEKMIIQIINRAKFLKQNGEQLQTSPSLLPFLKEEINFPEFKRHQTHLKNFMNLDDYDLWGAIKLWSGHSDKILSVLCSNLLNRRLFKVQITHHAPDEDYLDAISKKLLEQYNLGKSELGYFMVKGILSNAAYQSGSHKINILTKEGQVVDIAQASDLPNIKAISQIVKKHYLCFPKDLNL
jgi:HD superfamily phosphohydrolase